jgi:hypothetical protein
LALQKFSEYVKYIILEFIPSTILSYPILPLFLEQFQQVSFSHFYTCAHSICAVFTLPQPLPRVPICCHPPAPGRTCSALLLHLYWLPNFYNVLIREFLNIKKCREKNEPTHTTIYWSNNFNNSHLFHLSF